MACGVDHFQALGLEGVTLLVGLGKDRATTNAESVGVGISLLGWRGILT